MKLLYLNKMTVKDESGNFPCNWAVSARSYFRSFKNFYMFSREFHRKGFLPPTKSFRLVVYPFCHMAATFPLNLYAKWWNRWQVAWLKVHLAKLHLATLHISSLYTSLSRLEDGWNCRSLRKYISNWVGFHATLENYRLALYITRAFLLPQLAIPLKIISKSQISRRLAICL